MSIPPYDTSLGRREEPPGRSAAYGTVLETRSHASTGDDLTRYRPLYGCHAERACKLGDNEGGIPGDGATENGPFSSNVAFATHAGRRPPAQLCAN